MTRNREYVMNYATWTSCSNEEFKATDVAALNLEAARGLPGAEELDIPTALVQLDHWAKFIARYTQAAMEQGSDLNRERTPEHFRMLVMATALPRHLGVKYNQSFISGDYDGRDSRSLFIHGLLEGFGGTCASLPVLTLVLGRRLGYPLHLVEAKEHFFVRWDDGDGLVFNVECASHGFNSHPNEHYEKWPRPIKKSERHYYLRNLTPSEEASAFLTERGACLQDNLHLEEAIVAFEAARTLAPAHPWSQPNIDTALALRAMLSHSARFSDVAKRWGQGAAIRAQTAARRLGRLSLAENQDQATG